MRVIYKQKLTKMQFNDLSNNEHIPVEQRVKHLEREAAFVREYVLGNNTWKIVCIVCSVTALALSILSLLR